MLLFFETGIVVGFFIPGELATILGGVLASEHHASLAIMIPVVVAAAVLGNTSGYEIGRHIGPWLLDRRFLRGKAGIIRAEQLIARRGGPAIFIGRWIVFVRAVLPGIAGVSRMQYRVFFIFTLLGGIVWGTLWVLVGYAAGDSYTRIESDFGSWSLVVVGFAVVGLGVFLFLRKRKERRDNLEILEKHKSAQEERAKQSGEALADGDLADREGPGAPPGR